MPLNPFQKLIGRVQLARRRHCGRRLRRVRQRDFDLAPAIVDCEPRILLAATAWFVDAPDQRHIPTFQVIQSTGGFVDIVVNRSLAPVEIPGEEPTSFIYCDTINIGSVNLNGREVLTVNEEIVCDNDAMRFGSYFNLGFGNPTRLEVLKEHAISVNTIVSLSVSALGIDYSGVSSGDFTKLKSTGSTVINLPGDAFVRGSFTTDLVGIEDLNPPTDDETPPTDDDEVESEARRQVAISTGEGAASVTVYLSNADYTINTGTKVDSFVLYGTTGDDVIDMSGRVGGGFSLEAEWMSLAFTGGVPDKFDFDLREGNDQLTIDDIAGSLRDTTTPTFHTRFFAGDGSDVIDGSLAGNFRLSLHAGDDDDEDTLKGGDGRDTLTAPGTGRAVIHGNGDRDTIVTGNGNDEIHGGGGNDTIVAGGGNDHVYGDAGNDRIEGQGGTDFLEGGNDEDTLLGGDEIDTLLGGKGNDTLNGENGDDKLFGGDDTDFFLSSPGSDTILGEDGDDRIFWNPGHAGRDDIDGGIGNDLYVAEENAGPKDYLIDDDTRRTHILLKSQGQVVAQMQKLEHILLIGSSENDVFTVNPFIDPSDVDEKGNSLAPLFDPPVIGLSGKAGAEDGYGLGTANHAKFYVLGGAGKDIVAGSEGNDVILAGSGDDDVDGHEGDDFIFGMDGEDTLTGHSDKDWIIGGADKDTVFGGADDDWIVDSLTGVADEVKKKLTEPLLNQVLAYIGSEIDEILVAEKEEGGLNEFHGDDGSDILIGGTGMDTLYGDHDEGNAQVTGLNYGDVILGEGFELTASVSFETYFAELSNWSLNAELGIKPAKGMKDKIWGGPELDLILGGNGDDEIDAGTGSAIILGDSVKINLISVTLNKSEASFSLLPSIELDGSGNDTITAGYGDDPFFNLVLGGDGNDKIYGGDATIDFLFGNAGNDTIIAGKNDGGDLGADVVVGGAGDDPELRGGNFANVIVGDSFEINAFSNLSWSGLKQGKFNFGIALTPAPPEESGNDKLFGGDEGFDFLVGGWGDDRIDGGLGGLNVAFGDTFSFEVSVGIDVGGLVDDTNEQAEINSDPTEVLDLFHTKFKFVGNGEDEYFGGGGTDVAFGGDGKDTLLGGVGWDFLVGGGDDDEVNGGPGASLKLGNVVVGGPGDDTLTGGEHDDWLESEEGNDKFYGLGGNDVIRGGAGDDELFGGEGDDELFGEEGADLLDGGAGNDTLTGGAGLDRFEGGSGANTIVDPDAAGIRVEQILVNGGAIQRSNIESLQVRFSEALNLQSLIDSGAIVNLVSVDALLRRAGRISLTAAAYRWNATTRTLTIDLTTDGFGGKQTTRLHDDEYGLSIATGLNARFEDSDGVNDGVHRFEFHRLAGDYNGDRVVNSADGSGWINTSVVRYGAKRGAVGYDAAYDLDGDGVISSRDYYFWSRNLVGRSLT